MLLKKANEIREARMVKVKQSRDILDKAEKENRDLTAEESEQFDKLNAEIDADLKKAERYEKQAELEKAAAAPAQRQTDPAQPGEEDDPARRDAEPDGDIEVRYQTAFGAKRALEFKRTKAANPEYRKAYERFLRTGFVSPELLEMRATLQADADEGGGYIVAPQQMSEKLIQAADDAVFIRSKATYLPLNKAQSLGVPSLDTDPNDADWTGEINAASEDTAMTFGKRELNPHPLSKLVKVSRKLLQITAGGAEALVRQRLAYKFNITQEKGFLTGSGAGQPLGLFTATANGISTGRDVSADNTTTAMTADGLLNAQYSLKGEYLKRSEWLFHRDGVKQIRKLKAHDSQYIWVPGAQAGQPDTLFGKPVNQSEYVPNTFTTGLYVGMIADFSYYWIAEYLSYEIQRLNELYALTNQVGFIGRAAIDGMPVLEEAFARVTLA